MKKSDATVMLPVTFEGWCPKMRMLKLILINDEEKTMEHLPARSSVLFGAAYYNEYQLEPHLDYDLDLMKEANFSVIRVGEGSWSHWEPEDGKFSLEWLQEVLDGAHARGIQVIIGTPTFAVPQWMVRKYPEVAITQQDGTPMFFGGREEHNYTHPVFRFHAERVIRKIVERYADHPAVIGWQVHNEPGLHINYSRDAFEGFKDYLRNRYGNVDKLNHDWGLVFWSHELSCWDDLWLPQGNAVPQYDIEWRRYQAALSQEMIGWQQELVRTLCRPDQFVTTCISLDRPAIHESQVADRLDIAAVNPYYHMQEAMTVGDSPVDEQTWVTSGAWSVSLLADRSYAVKQAPYLVFETDGGPIGGAAGNYPGFDGQWRQAAWQFISRGAEMIEYWHWQSLHHGTETYWGGVLPHDRKPGRVYKQLAQLGAELNQAGSDVVGLVPDSDIAIVYSVQSKWGLAYEPHRAENIGDPHHERNERAYQEINEAFYRGIYASGHQACLYHDTQLWDAVDGVIKDPGVFAQKHKVLVAAGLYISSEGMRQWLRDYVANGGHLVLGPRTAYADTIARPTLQTKPTDLVEVAGVHYQEFTNLRQPLPVEAKGRFKLRDGAAATDWLDLLEPDAGTEILVANKHPQFGSSPVVTLAEAGRGKVTTVGTVPNTALAQSIVENILGGKSPWTTASPNLTHASAINPDGRRLHFVFNWSWEPIPSQALPVPCTLLGDAAVISEITLGPWDVAVLMEAASQEEGKQ